MGSGFLKKKKQARQFQDQLMQMQNQFTQELDAFETTGSAGNGLVATTINGSGELIRIKIKKECVDPEDVEGLETLVKAAFDDAAQKLKDYIDSKKMNNLPDMSMLGF